MKRDCQCPRARHVHGTPQAYRRCGCRCDDCRKAHRTDRAAMNRRHAYGIRQVFLTDAAPVRAHIAMLRENGISIGQICNQTGMHMATINAIVYGRPAAGREPNPTVTEETARKILAVRSLPANTPDRVAIDGTGTRRRVQALYAIGYGSGWLAERLGTTQSRAHRLTSTDRVNVKTARRIAALYDQVWDKPRAGTDKSTRMSAGKARSTAAKYGWLPPAAWDDDLIDDPAHTPDLGVANRYEQLQAWEDDVEFIVRNGTSKHDLEERLGMKWNGIASRLRGRGRMDLIDRIVHQDTYIPARAA